MDIVQKINSHLNALAPHVKQRETATLLRDAVTEIEALRLDKARIDWLADLDNPLGNVHLPEECVYANTHSLRDAIDMAMLIKPEELE